MVIHTVASGDTIFKIARRYSVQPTKIMEDNGLESDRLSVGQELLILTPTRAVTVRGGDTLASLARRFGVRKSTILANNPALCGKERVRAGHILSIKYDTPRASAASAVGFCRSGCRESKLVATLPYLTYVVFECVGIYEKNRLKFIYDAERLHSAAASRGKLCLLGFEDKTGGDFLGAEQQRLIDSMIALAKEGGYGGIYISADTAQKRYPDTFSRFLLEARKMLIGCDLILFSAADLAPHRNCAELCDGAILKDIFAEGFSEASRRALADFAENSEAVKSFVYIDALSAGDERISYTEALKLARQYGADLTIDEQTLLSTFKYRRYLRGKGEEVEVRIPQLNMTKAKLKSVSELGFMGIAFDIETVPVWLTSLFNSYFSRADFSLFSEG